jgi:hypothetical protein
MNLLYKVLLELLLEQLPDSDLDVLVWSKSISAGNGFQLNIPYTCVVYGSYIRHVLHG